MRYRQSRTQKEFLRAAAQHGVRYEPPATFRAGAAAITVRSASIVRFLHRLSVVMSFDDYDRLTREVWVAHLRAQSPGSSPP